MLLPPRRHATLERLYARYGRHLLRSEFARVWLADAGSAVDQAHPIVAVANHSSWWDPIVATTLSHEPFRRDPYGIMDGVQLRRYPFFRQMGGYGVTTHGLGDARQLADLTGELLGGGHRRMVWVFPQGALLPPTTRLQFQSGVARILRRCADAVAIPVAIRYVLLREQRPECLIRIGSPVEQSGGVRELTRALEAAVECLLTHIDADILGNRRDDYRVLVEGRASLSALFDRIPRWPRKA